MWMIERLARLAALLERCAERWSLELGERLEGGYLAEVRGCTGPEGERVRASRSAKHAHPFWTVKRAARA